jgi:hypothetical protein
MVYIINPKHRYTKTYGKGIGTFFKNMFNGSYLKNGIKNIGSRVWHYGKKFVFDAIKKNKSAILDKGIDLVATGTKKYIEGVIENPDRIRTLTTESIDQMGQKFKNLGHQAVNLNREIAGQYQNDLRSNYLQEKQKLKQKAIEYTNKASSNLNNSVNSLAMQGLHNAERLMDPSTNGDDQAVTALSDLMSMGRPKTLIEKMNGGGLRTKEKTITKTVTRGGSIKRKKAMQGNGPYLIGTGIKLM